MKFSALLQWKHLPKFSRRYSRAARALSSKGQVSAEDYPIPKRYREHLGDQCFWDEFSCYAKESGAINLGVENQWCMGCDYTRKQLAKIAGCQSPSLAQYTRSAGHPRLAKALAAFYDRYLLPNIAQPETLKKINPMTEIIITNGVQEAIYIAIMAILERGDQIVIIEPAKNTYTQVAVEAGAKIKYIPVKPKKDADYTNCDNWRLDEVWLGQIVDNKTKMIILNTPQFPLGKIWRRCELEIIAHYCKKWNIMVVSDESREYLVHEPNKHVHMCSINGMWERTISIWSCADLFGLPGWTTACLYGPDSFIKKAQLLHQDMLYTHPTPIQEALAVGMEREVSNQCTECTFFASLIRGCEPRRRCLFNALNSVGFKCVSPQADFWMTVNWKPLSDRCTLYDYSDKTEDFKFNKWLSDNLKFQGIPCTAFYNKEHKHFAEHYICFCFMNEMKNIIKVKKILDYLCSKG